MSREGISVGKKIVLNTNDLYFQICPIAHNPDLWNGDCKGMIKNSPHVQFLREYEKMGKRELFKPNNIKQTNYHNMFKYWDEIGYGLGGRTYKYIHIKAARLASVYDDMRSFGYRKGSRIQVLKTCLWTSRGFSGREEIDGMEIFHGHHRTACAYVLGIEKIYAHLCKDKARGSKLWVQKLDNMKEKP